mmetsp:Transcript_37805/g.55771  ORF Transcript_37805/g.55771 Transcript_37805/m.55771 type:complete len:93 (-) Transcript_37805:19-297(-)
MGMYSRQDMTPLGMFPSVLYNFSNNRRYDEASRLYAIIVADGRHAAFAINHDVPHKLSTPADYTIKLYVKNWSRDYINVVFMLLLMMSEDLV